MTRFATLGLVSLGLLASLGAEAALAQRPGVAGARGPGLSPYLNLRRGGNQAANYYLGVVPEFDRRATKAQQGGAIQDLERRVDAPPSVADDTLSPRLMALPPTGHATFFGNYGGFFSLQNAAAPGAAGSAGARPRGR